MTQVVIYTTHHCPYCMLARRLLEANGVAYEEVLVDDTLRDWLIERSGQRTVPQIFVDDRPIGGYLELAALQRTGQLDRILRPPEDC